MIARHQGRRHAERGSAMILTVLIMVVLTLLGVAYLLLGETENRIAENERRGAQALYAAESGVRMVKRWFDQPLAASNLDNPSPSVVDRTLRLIDADGDPATSPVAADGSAGKPYYKQGVDRNGDNLDDLFDKPYRDSLTDTFLGTEDGPDLRIDESGSAAARTFLQNLSAALFGDYPAAGTGVRARLARIDVYAPPYIQVGGAWTRYGIATVKVIARIYKTHSDGSEVVLGERMVKAVFNETPYPGPYGPLHSCDNLSFNGDLTVHWGVTTAVSNTDLTNNHQKVAASLPRVEPPSTRVDMLWGYDAGAGSDANFLAYKAAIEGEKIEDPWLRVISGSALAGAPNGNTQPYPFTWTPGNPLDDGHWPNHDNNPDDGSHSNQFQNMPLVTCPDFDYEVWKAIATSGGSNVHYYVWDNGSSFKENGVGTARTFREITDSQSGLFFFDTKDGLAPYDNDGDGEYDNLTPKITIQGGTWGVKGFIYLNASDFQTKGVAGRPATYRAPGEPFLDKDQDGTWDAGEPWINLQYPNGLDGDFVADADDTLQDDGGNAGPVVRNTQGPPIDDEATIWGVLYTNGYWDATGSAKYYGSVISKQGIGESSPSAGTPDLYWDESIARGQWPPREWELPRVVISRWETDM